MVSLAIQRAQKTILMQQTKEFDADVGVGHPSYARGFRDSFANWRPAPKSSLESGAKLKRAAVNARRSSLSADQTQTKDPELLLGVLVVRIKSARQLTKSGSSHRRGQ